jgi:hypothetical protein
MEWIMDLVFLVAASLALLWLSALSILSEKPQARVARAVLASAGVVAGAWASSASAGMNEVGDVSLVITLLRALG